MAGDWSLIKLALLVNVAVVLAVWFMLYVTFPKRVRHALARNATRLDGTISPRRLRIEKQALYRWSGDVLFAGLIMLLVVNVVLFAMHSFVVPFPVAQEQVAESSLVTGTNEHPSTPMATTADRLHFLPL